MPEEEPVTTENSQPAEEAELPDKLRGKSAAEMAQMYLQLESKLGEMGQELGQLRAAVQEGRPREEYTRGERREYSDVAERLLLDPDSAVEELARRVRREAVQEATKYLQESLSYQSSAERYFRSNPDLEPYRDVVAIAMDYLYRANPSTSLPELLEKAGQVSRAYLADLAKRIATSRSRAGVTTGGGPRAQAADQAAAAKQAPRNEVEEAIEELKRWRANRAVPPLAAAAKPE